MTLHGALISFVIASAIGLSYHLLRGGGFRRLLLYLIVSWIAFFAGHGMGSLMQWDSLRLGSLNLLPAALMAVVSLVLAEILAGPRPQARRSPRKPRPPKDDEL
ncbi:MAG TPA: hypothetical protein G4O08_06815 [Anaerolineae bacterium]|nr:hypothetical protein [Anaerolineae bacterium]